MSHHLSVSYSGLGHHLISLYETLSWTHWLSLPLSVLFLYIAARAFVKRRSLIISPLSLLCKWFSIALRRSPNQSFSWSFNQVEAWFNPSGYFFTFPSLSMLSSRMCFLLHLGTYLSSLPLIFFSFPYKFGQLSPSFRSWLQFSSVTQLCLTLCDAMDCSTAGFPVHHQLPELVQTHVDKVDDGNQPSHPLSSPSPPAFNLSQHQGLFQWVHSSHQVPKVLELQHQSLQWIFRTDFL